MDGKFDKITDEQLVKNMDKTEFGNPLLSEVGMQVEIPVKTAPDGFQREIDSLVKELALHKYQEDRFEYPKIKSGDEIKMNIFAEELVLSMEDDTISCKFLIGAIDDTETLEVDISRNFNPKPYLPEITQFMFDEVKKRIK